MNFFGSKVLLYLRLFLGGEMPGVKFLAQRIRLLNKYSKLFPKLVIRFPSSHYKVFIKKQK